MNSDLLDILACPLDGASPLHCVRPGADSSPNEIESGFLICPSCLTAWPIFDGVPLLVRGGLRQRAIDEPFFAGNQNLLEDWANRCNSPTIPHFHDALPTDYDKNLMKEGDYWGRYLKANVDLGDRSILDCRCPGTHRPYLHGGVAARDNRDAGRKDLGIWPRRLSRALRKGWAVHESGRALDVGCGGGQFGLEPAYLGMDVTGIDISFHSLQIARRHALSVGLPSRYVYADPAQPPFRKGVFDLLMSKDSLHHIADARGCLKTLEGLLAPTGRVIFYEHVGEARLFRKIRNLALSRLLPILQRNYERIEIPSVFREGSIHEDIGRDATVDAIEETFAIDERIDEIYLYFEIERLFYFALGRRPFPSQLVGRLTWLMEQAYLVAGRPDHVMLLGHRKIPPSKGSDV